MRISASTVRIELIPEDQTEKLTLHQLAQVAQEDTALKNLFHTAIKVYDTRAAMVSLRFMEFPRVALCRFDLETSFSPLENSIITEGHTSP